MPQSIQIGKGKTGQGTTISELGRWKLAFGYGTHTVKVVREDQPDLLGTTVSVNIVGGIDGTFLYSALSALVILEAMKRTIWRVESPRE